MSDVKENIKDTSIWLRGLYMLLFAVFFSVGRIVLTVVVVIQFLIRLLSGELNQQLLGFGSSLSHYLHGVMLYLTFNTEQRPFPFSDWPEATPPAEEPESAKPASSAKKRPSRKKRSRPKASTAAKKKEAAAAETASESTKPVAKPTADQPPRDYAPGDKAD